MLELDFESPRLLALVSALGPAYLRIGGSLDKQVVYAFPGTDIKWNSSRCPAKLCLNASRWDQLHTFVASTNSKLVFGLSYPGDKSGVWGSGPAEAVWKYSAAKGYGKDTTMYGFEVGEELTKYRVKTKKLALNILLIQVSCIFQDWDGSVAYNADSLASSCDQKPLLTLGCRHSLIYRR